ncbi:hypothetical protein J4732_08835 [Serratia marcescens]|uniref:Uncharacterized protein n=1 Tax=Serratia marcescens TaxID=615 RepID=A0A939SV70_SERMA|nr:hypothetical protein [Serratia marcescens]
MATTVQARAKCWTPARATPPSRTIGGGRRGKHTTDPFAVSGLLPIAGPKGYADDDGRRAVGHFARPAVRQTRQLDVSRSQRRPGIKCISF